MKQVFRRAIDRGGKVVVEDVPAPRLEKDQILVANHYSLISSGTEGGTIRKTPPQLIKQTLADPWMRAAVKNILQSGGIKATAKRVIDELTLFRSLGYSTAGIVLNQGEEVAGIRPGDRVACMGGGFANHAEVVRVPNNMFVPVPPSVSLKEAAFVAVGAISIQGVRRAEIVLGEKVVVYGLGLLGQLTARILKGAGAEVIGIDLSPKALALASGSGIEHLIDAANDDVVQRVLDFTGNKGADAVIICASSNDSAIVNNAMKMSRRQGRVVSVGLVKMEIERMPFFVNELDFRFSRAYGPGSYNEAYEKGRIDFPFEYIRWSAQSNMKEFIRLLNNNTIDIRALIGDIFPVEQAEEAYEALYKQSLQSVAALIEYPVSRKTCSFEKTTAIRPSFRRVEGKIRVGLLGCGNFTRGFRLPNLAAIKDYEIRAIASASGVAAKEYAQKHNAAYATSDYRKIVEDQEIELVLIATRHNLHSKLAIECLEAGKAVFVEKPLAMNREELELVRSTWQKHPQLLMVGYNRRHAPQGKALFKAIDVRPLIVRYTVNSGRIPPDHWTLDPVEGGGRLIGESDHFFDFMLFLADSRPRKVFAQAILGEHETIHTQYNFVVSVSFDNGSLGQLLYTGFGNGVYPREQCEIFSGGKVLRLEDFKTLIGWEPRRFKKRSRPDLGHKKELEVLAGAFRENSRVFDPAESVLWPTLISLAAIESLQTGKSVNISY
jgi:predicted dehydrogenase/threonine dehydrogenase-like Zn-dependent dehydrogenase